MEVVLASEGLGKPGSRTRSRRHEGGGLSEREHGSVAGHLESVLSMDFSETSLLHPGPSLQTPLWSETRGGGRCHLAKEESQGCHLVELGIRVALRPDPLPWLGHTKDGIGSRLCPSSWAGAASYSLTAGEDTYHRMVGRD